jgi:hypothetical protein
MFLPTKSPALSAIPLSIALALLPLFACERVTRVTQLVVGGGKKEMVANAKPPPPSSAPHVLIFALDGVGHDQFMEAVKSGRTPQMEQLLGKPLNDGNFRNGYSIPNAVSVLPSITIAAWTSIFTGQPPAYTSIPGNEWFARDEQKFYAPAPVSLEDSGDALKAINDDLIGNEIKVPTLYEMTEGPSFVSLNEVYRGAAVFTIGDTSAFMAMTQAFLAARLGDSAETRQSGYAQVDLASVPLVVDNIEKHGVPALQVVYFPGVDLYTHVSANPLHDEVRYIWSIIDPSVGQIADEYRKEGALDSTYVIFISDHGHTPVIKDEVHALGAMPGRRAPAILEDLGFKPRPAALDTSENDYSAVLAYQGAMAFIYLADRSTCSAGEPCDWKKPPRFGEDVMPVVRAFYDANRFGKKYQLKDTLDLIFARKAVPVGMKSQPMEVFDGHRLVPIEDYFKQHPRLDLLQMRRRMDWLAVGPWGDRCGDVILMSKSGLNRPIQDRYYFSHPYNSWHGSPSMQDSKITFVLAHRGSTPAELKEKIGRIGGSEPSQLDVTPLTRALLRQAPSENPRSSKLSR